MSANNEGKRYSRRDVLKGAATAGAVLALGPSLGGVADAATRSQVRKRSANKLGGSITVFSDANPAGNAVQVLLHEFQAETGVSVNYQLLSETVILNKAAVALAAGDGSVDVSWSSLTALPSWVSSGWLEPLNPYLADHRLVGRWYDAQDFVHKAYAALHLHGKQWGLPFLIGTKVMYFRKDILAKHHLAPPETIDDFMHVAEVVNSKHMPAVTLRGARGTNSNLWDFTSFYYADGARYFKNPPSNLTPETDTRAALTAMEQYTTLFRKYSAPSAVNNDFPQVLAAMANGQAVMTIEGAPLASTLFSPKTSKVPHRLGVGLVPAGPDGRYPGLDAQSWVLAKGSKNPEAAAAFIAWASSKEIQRKAALSGTDPGVTSVSVIDSPEFAKIYNYDGGRYVSMMRETVKQYIEPGFIPNTSAWPTVGSDFSIALSNAISGQTSPRAALATATSEIKSYLAQNGG